MSTVTNTYRTTLGLPNGVQLQPGVPTPVRNWATIKENRVVAAWLKRGILVEGGNTAPSKLMPEGTGDGDGDSQGSGSEGTEGNQNPVNIDELTKPELLARLEGHGIKVDKRTGEKKLRELLAEAEKAKAEEGSEAGEQA